MTTEAERFVKVGRAADARRLLHVALRKGKILRGPCRLCGAERAEAHHPDYEFPLHVIWLCRKDHSLVTRVQPLARECFKVLNLAVQSGALWAVAEVFAQELTKHQHRSPHCNSVCLVELREKVEKVLVLLLLGS